MKTLTPKEIVEAWYAGDISPWDAEWSLRQYVTPDNIISIMDMMPKEISDSFLDFAHGWVVPGEIISIGDEIKKPDSPTLIEACEVYIKHRKENVISKP